MGRRVVRLTLDNLADLPCADCVFWELDPIRREAARGHEREEKASWLSEVLREWGSCGRVVYVDDEYAGHLVWAPPVFLPAAAGFPTAPVSADAVLLSTGFVVPRHRHGGLGRVLVQSMAKDLIKRGGIRAVEAFGDTRGSRGRCVLPADFLLAVGFATQRAHAAYPRMRMELRSAVTWRSELEAALERLLPVPGRLRPGRVGPATPARSRRVAR
ncbi:GNAT family N-acetyltransferase [Nocardioides terrisoli]|uniref:GNAT family N-acetyltransferase n=1 Tax=Nocardioides terrisoli TaxID=3388267 RepID=UPI00287B90A9|nr:GNAT family N-acetyltransferase [Nocardioides marmorisolisilvae]